MFGLWLMLPARDLSSPDTVRKGLACDLQLRVQTHLPHLACLHKCTHHALVSNMSRWVGHHTV